ncbi:hypothetical protein [Bdellovibrio sp. HCB288]|uniref:hypothetical protein n=1 Tax=Bdellovibrio sp. HCB288 TaxID=3394355 RepID=UPI0039B63A5D
MEDLDSKKKVLEEIMALMDEKEGEGLARHPKLVSAKVDVVKPEVANEENPSEALLQEKEESDEEELSPEMIQKVLEMYKDME